MDNFIGKWEVVAVENFEPMMEVMGMAEEARQMMRKQMPVLEYNRDGDSWTMTLTTPFISKSYKFQSGEELDTVSIDGRPVKSMTTIQDNKFVEQYKFSDHESEVTREIVGDELVVTMRCKGVTSSARHKKVA